VAAPVASQERREAEEAAEEEGFSKDDASSEVPEGRGLSRLRLQ